MKKLTPLLLFVTFVITSFTNTQAQSTKVGYAFVTDTERDKSIDEDGNNGYVSITTNIVAVECNIGTNAVESQYIKHYDAEERNQNRDRAFIGASGITSAWIYNTYDEALASRRDWLAKQSYEHKRRIEYFYVTCN